jgi:hypothetical protein
LNKICRKNTVQNYINQIKTTIIHKRQFTDYQITRNVSSRHGCPRKLSDVIILSSKFVCRNYCSQPLKLFNVNTNHFQFLYKVQGNDTIQFSPFLNCILHICSQNNDYIHFHKSMSAVTQISKFVQHSREITLSKIVGP